MSQLLQINHLTKSYGGAPVLSDVSFTLPRGQIVGLLGRNGAGKTTLIKLINGLLVPTSGEIVINGQSVGVASKSVIAYLPERTYLDQTMRVSQAVQFFSEFYDNFDTVRANQLLADLDLDPSQRIVKMSKGMQEKLQLILVMSRQADLYILDEPLGGVDPATRDYILDTILSNFREGASVIISTHLIADIERILDSVIFIDGGRLILQDTAEHIRASEHSSIDAKFRQMFRAKSSTRPQESSNLSTTPIKSTRTKSSKPTKNLAKSTKGGKNVR